MNALPRNIDTSKCSYSRFKGDMLNIYFLINEKG